MGDCMPLSVTAKWLMQSNIFQQLWCVPEYMVACRWRGISWLYSFQFRNLTHLRKARSWRQAGLCLQFKHSLLPLPHSQATAAADAEHALHPLAASYHPSCTRCRVWVALHCAQSWWTCTDSDKEVPVQSQQLKYNKSFGFPWHPSRKVEGTENEVAELLTKIIHAF